MNRLRVALLAAALLSLGFWFPWSRAASRVQKAGPPAARAEPAPAAVDFERQIKPILAARCQPCHFPGGIMHQRLPFDDPRTIEELGTQLFTRIRDEKERAQIRAFLAQPR